MDAVRALVVRSAFPQLEAARELGVDRQRESLHLIGLEVARQCERRELRMMEDLVRPRTSDSRDHALVAE